MMDQVVLELDNYISSIGKEYFINKYSGIRIEDIYMSYRSTHQLQLAGINTLSELMICPLEEIIKIDNLGRKCLREIIEIKKQVLNSDRSLSFSSDKIANNKRINDYYKSITISHLKISAELKYYCYVNKIKNLYDLLLLQDVDDTLLVGEFETLKEDFYYTSEGYFVGKYICDINIDNIEYIDELKLDKIMNVNDNEYDKYIDFGIKVGEIICEFLERKETSRKSQIFKYRMNMIYDEDSTLESVGRKFGVTRERIRQIILKTTRKFQHPYNKKLYLNLIVDLIKGINSDEIINYYIYGIIGLYNKRFLKFILDSISIKYSNNVFDKLDELSYILEKNNNKEKAYTKKIKKAKYIFDLISFPNNTKNYIGFFNKLIKRREVNTCNNIGVIHIDRLNKDLEYESGVEKALLELISSDPNVVDIKTQSLKIQYTSKDKSYDYYPDFQVLFKDGKMAIIEAKDLYNMSKHGVLVKYNALKDYCNKYGIGYLMVDDRLNSFEDITSYQVDEEKKIKFYNHLKEKKVLNYGDFAKLKKGYKFTIKDLISIVSNDTKIYLSTKPFYIKYDI